MKKAEELMQASLKMSGALKKIEFTDEITHIYNPIEYAWGPHSTYLERYANNSKKIIFLGMNPGPWGMAQTGLPFGEVNAALNWLNISGTVGKPAPEHPKRPVDGFSCARSEVSGRRLWGLMEERFGIAESFFTDHFVANYCPLSFMTESGRNFTPDKLPSNQREQLFEICDIHLRATVEILEAEWVIGVGKFAEKRINSACKKRLDAGMMKSGTIIHPSPASPAANRGWSEAVLKKMKEYGLW